MHVDTSLPQGKQIVIFNKSKRNSTAERALAHPVLLAGLGLADAEFYEKIGHVPRARQRPIRKCILEGELMTFHECTKRIELFGTVRKIESESWVTEYADVHCPDDLISAAL